MRVTLDIPDQAVRAFDDDPVTFGDRLRLAAAVKWFETGALSQGRASEVAGLSRAAFLDALGSFDVSPFQYSAEEIIAEASRGG